MTKTYLVSPEQIRGLVEVFGRVGNLEASYDACKVLTDIAKGQEPGNYNVNELLKVLKAAVDSITGDGGGELSLPKLKEALDKINGKIVKDIVKFELARADGHVALPENLAALAPGLDQAKEYPVYRLDNTSVFDETGKQLTFNFASGVFSGIPSVIDPSGKDPEHLKYQPLAGDFAFKVFGVGEFPFADLPADYLLDNQEMQLASYDQAIHKIVTELAKDKDLIEAIQALVGSEAVQAQIKAVTDVLAAAIDAANQKIRALTPIVETIALPAGETPTAVFAVTKPPNLYPVKLFINHIGYCEGEEFTVDRSAKELTWTATKANGGFDITERVASHVQIEYRSDAP